MPPKKSYAEPQLKDLYLFIVEAGQENGISAEYSDIVKKLVSDKIFAESADEVCMVRHDHRHFEYAVASWELLQKFDAESKDPAKRPPDAIESLSLACESVLAQAENDEYSALKVLYFGNFESYLVDDLALKDLQAQAEEQDIKITMIFPVELANMSPRQKENFDLLKTVVGPSENFFLFTYKEALGKILNIIAKKDKRSMAWNIAFEIAPGLEIAVKKLIINRKNTISYSGTESINTETMWTNNEGATVDESEVGDAYVYGDCLVSTQDVKSDEAAQGENACLKLLQFAPRENIQLSYLCGDGTDIFFPQDKNPADAVKFNALMKALNNTNRVAIVRKVWRKNANPVMGVLVPDLERKGLIYSDLCYADDISTPHFAPLIKEESLEGDGISEKDDVVDELIKTKSLNGFNAEKGPVDPAVLILRQAVTTKIINKQYEEEGDVKDIKKPKVHDNIELFFQNIVLSHELGDRLKNAFPLKVNKEAGADRPSGAEIFRKRGRKNEKIENGTEKKIKIEEETPQLKEEDPEEPEQEDIGNLLDEL